MNTLVSEQTLLDWETIKQLYPDSWVMIGYPESERSKRLNDSVGEVLYFDTDKTKFVTFSEENIHAYKAKKGYGFYSPRFTGESHFPKKIVLGAIHKVKNDHD
jgi:hypothetical protein